MYRQTVDIDNLVVKGVIVKMSSRLDEIFNPDDIFSRSPPYPVDNAPI